MLKLVNINKSYTIRKDQLQHVLKDMSVGFPSKGFVCILGNSGHGKTTMLNIIGGLDKPDAGEVYYNKQSIADYESFRREKVGFVFQEYNLIPHLSAIDNVMISMSDDVPRKKERARSILHDLDLADCLHKLPRQMSGGQQQRVAIARMIAKDVDIIVCDEPTGSLDSETETKIVDLIQALSKDKLVLFVTHNEDLANQYADHILRIHDGQMMDDPCPDPAPAPSTIDNTKSYRRNSNWISLKNLVGRFKYTLTYIILASFIMFIASLAIIMEGELFKQFMHENAVPKGIMNIMVDLDQPGYDEELLAQINDIDHVLHATYAYQDSVRISPLNYLEFLNYEYASYTALEDITGNPYFQDIITDGRYPESGDEVLMTPLSVITILRDLNIGGDRLYDQYMTGAVSSEYVFSLVDNRVFIVSEYGYPRIRIVGLVDEKMLHEPHHTVYFIDGFTSLYEHTAYTKTDNGQYTTQYGYTPRQIKLYKSHLYRETGEEILQDLQAIPNISLDENYQKMVDTTYNKLLSFLTFSKLGLYVIVVIALISFLSLSITSLLERKYEIGLYRAIGYNKHNINKILGLEMLAIGILAVGGVVGMLLIAARLMYMGFDYFESIQQVLQIINIPGLTGALLGIIALFVLLIVYGGNKVILSKPILSNINDL